MASGNVEYQIQAFKRLRELQRDGTLCDLVLVSMDHVEFRVHASVIVAASQSFYRLLMEKGALRKIRLINITGKALELLICFIYGENLDNYEDLKLLSQTLKKLGMKELFQFIGTSLCDFKLDSADARCPNVKSQDVTTDKKGNTSHVDENSNDENEHQKISVKPRGDNKRLSPQPVCVKVEPLSPGKKQDTESTWEEHIQQDFDSVKIKSEPNKTSEKNGVNLTNGEQYDGNKHAGNDEITLQSNGSTSLHIKTPTDACSVLKPVGLYINETLTKSKSFVPEEKLKIGLSNTECQAEKYGIVQPLMESGCSSKNWHYPLHSYKAVTDGAKNNTKQNDKIVEELAQSENDSEPNPSPHQLSEVNKNKGRKLIPKEKPVPSGTVESKQIPVLLRPVDDYGNYALFHATRQNDKCQTEISQTNNLKTTKEVGVDSHVAPVVKNTQAMTVTPSGLNKQPQMQTAQQIIISPNGQLISILPQTRNLTNPAAAANTFNNTSKPSRDCKPKPNKQTYIPLSKVCEIVPKGRTKIGSVSSQSKAQSKCNSKLSEPLKDCSSTRIQHFSPKMGRENVVGCKEIPVNGDKPRYNKDVNDSVLKSDSISSQRQVGESLKRKLSNDENHSPHKKWKESDFDADDADEYLVIDLNEESELDTPEEELQLFPNGGGVSHPFQVEKGKVKESSNSDLDLDQVIHVTNCTLEEVPHLLVPSKTTAKPPTYTLRKELNFFHDKDEIPPNTPKTRSKIARHSPTVATTKQSGLLGMSNDSLKSKPLPHSCVETVTNTDNVVYQNATKTNSHLNKCVSASLQKTVPVMVCLPDGQITTVMVQENVQGSPQVHAVCHGQNLPNTNTQPQIVAFQTTSSPFKQGPNLGSQGVSGVSQSGTQQLIQPLQQPLSNSTSSSNINTMQGLNNVRQPVVVGGNQVVQPQFVFQNTASQHLGQTRTPPDQTNVQFPRQQFIVQQTQPVAQSGVPVTCLVNPQQLSQTPNVSVTVPATQTSLQMNKANGSWNSCSDKTQLISSVPTNQITVATLVPAPHKTSNLQKCPVAKKIPRSLKELRPKKVL